MAKLRIDSTLLDVQSPWNPWIRTFPIFFALLAGSALAIFNYQKSSSPVIAGTMYALRTNKQAREILGDEIYFAHSIPWIWGEMNQLHGRINIQFEVKGTKQQGTMRFVSTRQGRQGVWETSEWSLHTAKEGMTHLLEEGEAFQMLNLEAEEQAETTPGRGLYSAKVYKEQK